jgi:VCBS repeat-containing protein
LGGDGSFAYTPDPGFVGTDGFTYHADDPTTSSGDVIVTITVVNTAPVAGDDGPYPVVEDTTLSIAAPGVLANDTDDDGDALSATLVADATNGTVTLQPDGSFDYVADPDFAGTDSFTYRTSDGLTSSLDATVSIAVTGSDDPPAASAESYATPEDTTLHVPAPGVLANDTELDGDPISATLVTPPVNGVLTLDPSGALTYTPGPDFHGADSFTYAVSDGTGSDTATVTLTISPVNDAPLAAPDSKATAHGTSTLVDVLANDADVDGDAIAIASVGTPSAGTAMVESGRIRYTPPAGFSGAATFSYTISDGTTTDAATVTITVAPVPTPVPTASPIPTPTPPAPVSPPASSPPTPATTPTPTPDPPAAPPSPSASAEPEISASPTATPEPEDGSPPPSPQPTLPSAPPSPSTGSGTEIEPLSVPQVTTGGFGSDEGSFEFAGLFDGFGGSFAWAMPAAILGVPGLLFMLAVAGQLLGAAAWVPTIRRMLAGIGVRRRRSA